MDAGGNRKHKRFLVDDCAVEVRCGDIKSLFAKGEYCPVLSLSPGGLQYVSFKPVEEGQRLNLSLRVGDQFDFLKAPGVVRWSQQIPEEEVYRVGVELTKLSDDGMQKLRDLRRAYLPRQQEILETGVQKLKVPECVAAKLAALLARGHGRRQVDAHAADEAGNGPWLDASRTPARRSTAAGDAHEVAPEEYPTHAEELPQEDRPAGLPTEHDHTRDLGNGMKAVPVIKLYWLGGKYETRLGKHGRPVGSMAKMWLPGLDEDHFACRLADNSMISKSGRSFNQHDVVVFSMHAPAKSGDYAFVGTKARCYFRRIHHTETGAISLTPSDPAYEEITLAPGSVEVMWPAVACLQTL